MVDTLKVYLSPTGNDENSGVAPGEPILTLERAQILVMEKCQDEPRNVEILLAPGSYHGQAVNWKFAMPNHSISIQAHPVDSGWARFIGPRRYFFYLSSRGQDTNIYFNRIYVQNYLNGIIFRGSKRQYNGKNRLVGCRFQAIGDIITGTIPPGEDGVFDNDGQDDIGIAALDLMNSRDNFIHNCSFINIINSSTPDAAGVLHAIYLAHQSSSNKILGCLFHAISGNPIKFRDYSNDNEVSGCNFRQAGVYSACVDSPSIGKGERPSWSNVIEGNSFGRTYSTHANPDGWMQPFYIAKGDRLSSHTPPTEDARRFIYGKNIQNDE